MKKNSLLLVIACIWALLFATGATALAGTKSTTEEPEPVKTAYGFLISDRKNPVGLYSFPVNDATKLTLIKETPKVSAGSWARDAYYGATYSSDQGPISWCKVDLKTGNMTVLAPLSGKMYSDMSYDYSSGKMYAISHPTPTSTELVIVNLADGSRQKVMDTELVLMTLACSFEGGIYSLDLKGNLYFIDQQDGYKVTLLGDLDFDLSYIQCMEFDHDSGALYWAASNSYNAAIYKINVDEVTKVRLCGVGSSGELSGVYVPFAFSEPGAPAAVENFTVKPVSGTERVKMEWTFPTKTVAGDPLNSMTSLNVECDGTLLKSYQNGTDFIFTVGGKKSVELDAPAGLHKFKVYVSNEAGAGVAVVAKAFSGQDVPAAPGNLKQTVNGSRVTLSWDAVTNGLKGGEIDLTSLTYSVTRYPDQTVLLKDGKQLTLTDEIPQLNVYSYEVTTATAKGTGGTARTEWTEIGNTCLIPYAYKFDDELQFRLWTLIDHNDDGTTWSCTKLDGDPTAMYRYSSDNAADDWLITPPLKLEAGQPYKVKFAYGVQSHDYPERLKVTIGKDKTVAAQTIVLGTLDTKTYGLNPAVLYLPDNLEAGNWYVGFQACSDKDRSKLYLSNVEVMKNEASELEGTVSSGGILLSGAVVTLSNSDKTYQSDAEGKFVIREINSGTYTLTISLFGYEVYTKEITFGLLDKNSENVELTPIPQVRFRGVVKTEKGESMPDATVSLRGYGEYTAQTDKDGRYFFESVYCKGTYILNAYALNYDVASIDIPAFAGEVTAGDLLLKEKLLSPSHVVAEALQTEVRLSWDKPEDRPVLFRYDDGVPPLYVLNMQFDATPRTISGTIYDTPAVFTGMSWQVANNNDPKTTVDIIVFDLDDQGNPTTTILFERKGIPSKDSYWSSYQFPYPVVAPRGALIALQGDAFLCMDYGESPEWPFRKKKSCLSFDYTKDPFTYLEDAGLKYNLLVRAEGLEMGAPHAIAAKMNVPAPQPEYRIWRTAESDASDAEKWTLLTPEPVKTTTFTDVTWKDAAKGTYNYVVKAIYSGNEYSYPAFSEMVSRLMTGDVTFTLTTNAGVGSQGAVLTLVNDDNAHSYKVVAGENGKALVPAAWEGNYTCVVKKEGFATITDHLTVEGGKNVEKAYTLMERALAPANLKIDANGTPGSRLFRWNVADKWEDDFEKHEDFAVNSRGKLGWNYIDGDGAETFASYYFDFPHRYEPMAFIVFNPSATTPSMLERMKPHSGDKLLCSFAGIDKRNNDYLISPELEMDKDFVIRFWACSSDHRSLEEIRVGYSVTGKKESDFVWVLESQKVPAKWTEYIVNIPKGAKFVTINCVSDGCDILMLDDIYIGTLQEDPARGAARIAGEAVSYEVFLDGSKLTVTTETSYTLTGLTKGNHVAGVKAVYASGTTSMSTLQFAVEEIIDGIGNEPEDNRISVYPLPATDILHIEGDFEEARLVDISGQTVLISGYVPAIRVDCYPAGVYYLVLVKDGSQVIRKVVIR